MDEFETAKNSDGTDQPTDSSAPSGFAVLKKEAPENAETGESEQYSETPGNNFKRTAEANMLSRVWIWIKNDTTSTDWLIVILTAVIAGTSYFQWQEIKSGGKDTHDLAVAAKLQAEKADTISQSMNQAVQELKASAEATGKQLAIARDQAKAAQDSAHAIQRQTEIGARPWLELSEIALTGPMTINMNGEARTTVHVVATNIGKTPAKEVSLWVELGEHVTEHEEIRRLCTMSVPTPKDAGKAGQILFPTKTLGKEENQTISIKLKQFTLVERKQTGTGYQESIRLDKNGPPSSQEQFIYSIPSSVIGCVQYKSFTSDVPYYTGFIYEIYPPTKGIEMFGYNIHFDRKTGIASNIPSTIPQENGTVTVPIEWLRLAQNRGWGNDIVK